jgi:hypothetical protein
VIYVIEPVYYPRVKRSLDGDDELFKCLDDFPCTAYWNEINVIVDSEKIFHGSIGLFIAGMEKSRRGRRSVFDWFVSLNNGTLKFGERIIGDLL